MPLLPLLTDEGEGLVGVVLTDDALSSLARVVVVVVVVVVVAGSAPALAARNTCTAALALPLATLAPALAPALATGTSAFAARVFVLAFARGARGVRGVLSRSAFRSALLRTRNTAIAETSGLASATASSSSTVKRSTREMARMTATWSGMGFAMVRRRGRKCCE